MTVDLKGPSWIVRQRKCDVFDQRSGLRSHPGFIEVEVYPVEVIFAQCPQRLLHCRPHRGASSNPYDSLRTRIIFEAELDRALDHHWIVLVIEKIEVAGSASVAGPGERAGGMYDRNLNDLVVNDQRYLNVLFDERELSVDLGKLCVVDQ